MIEVVIGAVFIAVVVCVVLFLKGTDGGVGRSSPPVAGGAMVTSKWNTVSSRKRPPRAGLERVGVTIHKGQRAEAPEALSSARA